MNNDPREKRNSLRTIFASWLTAADKDLLLKCPEQDASNIRAIADLMIFVWIYQTVVFFAIGQSIFPESGQIKIAVLLSSAFLATFIMMIESFVVMRSGWYLSGLDELKRGGLEIVVSKNVRVKTWSFVCIRGALASALASLTAIFLGLWIFTTDINAYLSKTNFTINAPIVRQVTSAVDDAIKRASDDVNTQTKYYSQVFTQTDALRQRGGETAPNELQVQTAQQELTLSLNQKAKVDDALRESEADGAHEARGINGKHSSGHVGSDARQKAVVERIASAREQVAKSERAVSAARTRLETARRQTIAASEATRRRVQDSLPEYEARLAEAAKTLGLLKGALISLVEGREAAIRKAVENAPTYVPNDKGLLAQITALDHVAQSDPKIKTVILLIDFVSFSLELAAVLAKVTAYVPSTYAAMLVRDSHLRLVRLADEMTRELDSISRGMITTANPPPASPTPPAGPAQTVPPPPRPKAANDNAVDHGPIPATVAAPADPPQQSPKRPRGRPPKGDMH